MNLSYHSPPPTSGRRAFSRNGPSCTLSLLLISAMGCALLLVILAAVAYLLYAPDSANEPDAPNKMDETPLPTAVAQLPPAEPAALPGMDTITFDATGRYVFPIAADPGLFVWTHMHWDNTHAVDVEARFGLDRAQFEQVTASKLVAITAGVAEVYNGNVGGLGYMLHGNDGRDYYYAHMAEQWVKNGAEVAAGDPLGLMGRTGNAAQYIEPHLHLAIGPRDSLWYHLPGVNGAEWLRDTFGLNWREQADGNTVEYDLPQGWPAHHPELAVVTPYAEALEQGLPQPAIEFGFAGAPPTQPVDLVATLAGVVNVIRWTTQYGTRIQITNHSSNYTVVISGATDWLVADGALVQRGQTVGRWDPTVQPRLHYMLFQNDQVADPTLTLGQP